MLVCLHVATLCLSAAARYLALGAQVREDTPPASGAPCPLLLWALQPGWVPWTLLSAHIFFLLYFFRDLSCNYVIGRADRTCSFSFWPMPCSRSYCVSEQLSGLFSVHLKCLQVGPVFSIHVCWPQPWPWCSSLGLGCGEPWHSGPSHRAGGNRLWCHSRQQELDRHMC